MPDGTMQQEQEYFKALQAVTEYDISANRQTLKLLYGDRKNNLLYTKKEELR
ncbi:TPA: META domain-containing protein [Candidatus Poribacteria bacterium]|nr:META domain-containing protein [Candidatus Poribacteria bacterium]